MSSSVRPETDGSFSKRNTAAGIAGLIQTAVKLVPSIADAAMVTQWTGLVRELPMTIPASAPFRAFMASLLQQGTIVRD